MRLALFEGSAQESPRLGIVTEAGVVPIELPAAARGDVALKRVIAEFEQLRPELEGLARTGIPLALDEVRMWPPLARPSKILCRMQTGAATGSRGELHLSVTSSAAALGAGGTIVLPELEGAELFTHSACVAVVIAGPAKAVPAAEWRHAVFGYTAMIDVTARTASASRWKEGRSMLGSSCDTFAPLGPWIVPREDLAEDGGFRMQLRNRGELLDEYRLDGLDQAIGESIELASTVMTLQAGDVIAIGGSSEGQRPLQDGDRVEVEFEGVGTLAADVVDPLRRRWDRDLRVGPDSDSADVSSLVENSA